MAPRWSSWETSTSTWKPLTLLQSLLAAFSSAITSAKRDYYQTKINKSMSNSQLFYIFSSQHTGPTTSVLHYCWWLHCVLWSRAPSPPPTHQPPFLSLPTDVSQLLHFHCPSTCALDPIPLSLLQAIAPDIIPFITSLVNYSLSSGCFPSSFKKAITPVLKKPTLEPSTIQKYRPA